MIRGAIYESNKNIIPSTNILYKITLNFLSVSFWHFNVDKAFNITNNSIINTNPVGL